MKDKKPVRSTTITNRKARHEYELGETFEAGIVLQGTEVKSLREGKAAIQESFCKVENGEVWIHGMHIAPYEQGNRWNVDPLRPRKLLLRAREIEQIRRQLDEKGLTLVPVKLYFTRGYAKLNVAIARGKKLYDKRRSIAERDADRDLRREQAARE